MDKSRFEEIEALWAPVEESAELPRTLDLESLELLPSVFQCREGADGMTGVVDQTHVAKLATQLSDRKANLDPVLVIPVGHRHILIEGHHRYAAYRHKNRTKIPVEVFRGTPREALIASGSENKKVRLQMTSMEQSERAWGLVKADLGLTVEQVMAGAGVSKRTVIKMRTTLKHYFDSGEPPPTSWRSALYEARESDPEWVDKQVKDFAERLTKAFGPSSKFSPGKIEILAEALKLWAPHKAEKVALELVAAVGLRNVLEERARLYDEDDDDCEF